MEPSLGEVKMACDIGKVGRTRYSWVMCPMCTEKRWATRRAGNVGGNNSRLCRQCVIEKAKRSFKIRNS